MNTPVQCSPAALIDANVLAESAVSDLLLRLAEGGHAFSPRWTDRIWQETHRTMVQRLGWSDSIAVRRIEAARAAFPEALLVGFEHREAECRNHPEDRHVLAAALHFHVPAIITMNVRDFPAKSLLPWKGNIVDPSDFLSQQFVEDSQTVRTILIAMARKRNRSYEGMLSRLSASVPDFARLVANSDGLQIPEYRPVRGHDPDRLKDSPSNERQ